MKTQSIILNIVLGITVLGSFVASWLSLKFLRINGCVQSGGQWLPDQLRCEGSDVGKDFSLLSAHTALEVFIQAALFWVFLLLLLSPIVFIVRYFVRKKSSQASVQNDV